MTKLSNITTDALVAEVQRRNTLHAQKEKLLAEVERIDRAIAGKARRHPRRRKASAPSPNGGTSYQDRIISAFSGGKRFTLPDAMRAAANGGKAPSQPGLRVMLCRRTDLFRRVSRGVYVVR